MYACMTSVGFDTSDKFENHWSNLSFKTHVHITSCLIHIITSRYGILSNSKCFTLQKFRKCRISSCYGVPAPQ